MKRALLALLLIPALAPAQVARFRVHETAGLRRFSYPVRASIPLDAGALHLLEEGKAVPAQFNATDGYLEVDFNVSLGPWETREFRVERGAQGVPGSGVAVDQANGMFAVRHANGLEFDVPENLLGLLSKVKTSKLEYLRPGSQGLLVNYKDDVDARVGGTGNWGEHTAARITKRGPIVSAVRFEGKEGLRPERSVKSVVDLDFPRSKAWVEVRWKLDDPQRFISGMTADLNLLLDSPPALVDFVAAIRFTPR